MNFDIKAPLERQRTRDGRKVLKICDLGWGIPYPIAVLLDGSELVYFVTHEGMCYSAYATPQDIITLPEKLPLIVVHYNLYPEGYPLEQGFTMLADAEDWRGDSALDTLETTYDPNNGKSSIKTVWRK